MASNINADNGVVSGSAGLKTSADSSGVLALQTNGTTAVTVNASQNVGVGATPTAWSLGKSIQIGTASDASVLGYNGSVYLTSNNYFNSGWIYAATGTAGRYEINTGKHVFLCAPSGTAGTAVTTTQVLSVEKDRSLSLQGATTQTGTGITFPATQSASSDANTLDDYEEGTWTVGFRDWVFDVNSSFTYTSRSATYTKIGRVVTCYFTATIATATAGNGQAFGLEGLPFDPNSSLPFIGTLATSGVDWPANTLTTAITYFSTTNAAIFTATGDNVSTIRLTSGGVSAGDVIQGSLVYYVA